MGRVEHIHIAPSKGAPVQSIDAIEAVMHVGLVGDRNALAPGEWNESHAGEELTLVEAESLEMLARDHDIHLQPGETRRNLTTRGVALNDLVGRRFRVGGVLAQGVELCEPCEDLQRMVGKPILRPLVRRAGLRALLLNSGTIRVGDAVEGVAEGSVDAPATSAPLRD
jgi:MOSC domain-containing protein YiiM